MTAGMTDFTKEDHEEGWWIKTPADRELLISKAEQGMQ
jgi:hypothetical protein